MAALFIGDQNWKQPKCLSTRKIDELWHIHTVEHYSAIKEKVD